MLFGGGDLKIDNQEDCMIHSVMQQIRFNVNYTLFCPLAENLIFEERHVSEYLNF